MRQGPFLDESAGAKQAFGRIWLLPARAKSQPNVTLPAKDVVIFGWNERDSLGGKQPKRYRTTKSWLSLFFVKQPWRSTSTTSPGTNIDGLACRKKR